MFLLPGPGAIWPAFVENFASLMGSLWVTLKITWLAFAIAVAGGLGIAIVFSQSRAAEMALYPYAVVLQVTPVLAVAPLILIWTGYEHVERAAVIIALIVAFFRSCRTRRSACAASIPASPTSSASTAPRAGRCCGGCSFPARCPTSWPG